MKAKAQEARAVVIHAEAEIPKVPKLSVQEISELWIIKSFKIYRQYPYA